MKKQRSFDDSSLRQKAETKILKEYASELMPQDVLVEKSLNEAEMQKLLHELQVHQIELEIQNEELQEAKAKAEFAAEQYADLYEEIYDFSPAGYFTITPEGTICELNYNGAGMLGKVRSVLVGSNFRLFISQATLPIFNEFLTIIFSTGIKQSCEISLDFPDKAYRFLFLEGIVAKDKQKCLITAVDITERKRMEEVLRENEVSLSELNATKDKFFSIIAHDLRSPFNSILGFSNILAEQIQEKNYDGIESYANILQNSAQRAFSLLTNLLEWSRSQKGLMKFSPEYIELVGLINEITELLAGAAAQKSISIVKEVPQNVYAFADIAMISTILRNLISNAIKFTNPGGQIIIFAEQKPDKIFISVSDNGVGITKEAIGNLFRIEASSSTMSTSNETGTGLGLILCKEFVEKHRGKIWAKTELGKGSQFCFTIPVKMME